LPRETTLAEKVPKGGQTDRARQFVWGTMGRERSE